MHFSKIIAVTSLFATAIASGDTIVAAMETIGDSALDLNSTVAVWDGGLFSALTIVTKANALLGDTNDGTDVATASAALSDAEAVQVATATSGLAVIVESTLNTIVNARSKVTALGVGSIILTSLKGQKTATDAFAAAVVAKIPVSLQDAANVIIQGIDDDFDAAIAAYS